MNVPFITKDYVGVTTQFHQQFRACHRRPDDVTHAQIVVKVIYSFDLC